jgi:hypothetical protein
VPRGEHWARFAATLRHALGSADTPRVARVVQRRSRSDNLIQVAATVAGAVARVYEREDTQYAQLLRRKLAVLEMRWWRGLPAWLLVASRPSRGRRQSRATPVSARDLPISCAGENRATRSGPGGGYGVLSATEQPVLHRPRSRVTLPAGRSHARSARRRRSARGPALPRSRSSRAEGTQSRRR